MVLDLSAAEIPVVTPSLASIEVVKAVPSLDGFRCRIISSPKLSTRDLSSAKQINPLPKSPADTSVAAGPLAESDAAFCVRNPRRLVFGSSAD